MIGFILCGIRHLSNMVFIARFAPVVVSTAALGWMFWPSFEDSTSPNDVPTAQVAEDESQDDSVFQSRHYLVGWFVFALIWPILLIPITKRIVAKERNGFNLMALLGATAVPMALAYPVAFGSGFSIWMGLLWVTALIVVFLWCTWIMSRVVELSK